MQPIVRLFWAILFAHLLADFPFQTDEIIQHKKAGFRGYAEHGIIHIVTLELCVAIFASSCLVSSRVQVIFGGYVIVHLVIDSLKRRIQHEHDSTNGFLIDQGAHLVTISLVAYLLAHVNWQTFRSIMNWSSVIQDYVLIAGVIYVAVIFAGGYLIRHLTRSLSQNLQVGQETPDELRNAGMYIGWLERFLIVTAILMQSPAMVGLILTGKSIVRFPEIKAPRFAEYFLIGTFLSMGIAIVGGLLLIRVVYGTVSLK